jgi:transportin-3
MPVNDRREITEAISHILSAVPLKDLNEALDIFCIPIATRIHNIISMESPNINPETLNTLKGLIFLK